MTNLARASRWTVVLAVLAALAIGAPDAMAKHGKRGGESKHRQFRVYRNGGKGYRFSTQRYIVRDPRVVSRYETRSIQAPYLVERNSCYRPQVVREYRPYVIRDYRQSCDPDRMIYYGDRPYYFSAGLNFYFDNADLSLSFGQLPPVGYVYHDPVCGMSFSSAAAYQDHLRYHHHDPLVEVVSGCQPY